jgi:hypothetical protein
LPDWLARRLLRKGEEIAWTRGPRWNPWWERYVTHPTLFVQALALAVICVAAGRLGAGSWSATPPWVAVIAIGILLASVFVLGIFAGYFTRLVVTNYRVVIIQGFEVVRNWSVDELPRSLVRHVRKREGGPDGELVEKESRAVDVDAVQRLFGSAEGHFAEAKTILEFGKQLERVRRANDRPGHGPNRDS